MSSVPPKAWDEVQIGLLQRDVADLKRTAEKKPSKDIWDKFSALSGLVSGVVVALIGIYATTVLTRRQHSAEERRKDQEIRISRIQTVGTFMPQLAAGDERMKGVALVAIASLGDPDLAVRLAEALRGAGATSALTTIASGVDSSGAAGAKRALVDVLEFLKPRVVRVVTRGPGDDSRAGHGFVVSADGQIVTPAHVVDLPGATIEVMQGDQRRQAELKVIDKERDLALLSTKSAQSLVPLQISPAEPHAGERVSALFYVYDRPESPDNWRIQIGEVVGSNATFWNSVLPCSGSYRHPTGFEWDAGRQY